MRLWWLASTTGKPNISAKGPLRVLDDEHVVFADVASPRTVTNIKENPQVAIICLDVVPRRGLPCVGTGRAPHLRRAP
ncbi:MAG: pyridoxamine 5'-phosphate oxidase family protein [Thermodesulfobacteriota bacterium]